MPLDHTMMLVTVRVPAPVSVPPETVKESLTVEAAAMEMLPPERTNFSSLVRLLIVVVPEA